MLSLKNPYTYREGELFPAMGDENKRDEVIRKYLLGEVSEGEVETIEQQLMTDDEFFDRSLMVENALVEDFVEGRLSGAEREKFERLFLSTPQGIEQVRFTRALKEYASKSQAFRPAVESHRRLWPLAPGARAWAVAATALLLIAAGLGVWRAFYSEPELDEGLIALGRAYPERPVTARITGLKYAPRAEQRAEARERVDLLSLKRAERILEGEARKNPGPASFHALGRYYLMLKDFDRAIDYFRKALELEPNSAQIHSDLGAALLEAGRAFEEDDPGRAAEAFSESLGHLNEALTLDPTLLDALFNRALLYQQRSLFKQALYEWQEYLKRDPDSRWADEARSNIKLIEDREKVSSNKGTTPAEMLHLGSSI